MTFQALQYKHWISHDIPVQENGTKMFQYFQGSENYQFFFLTAELLFVKHLTLDPLLTIAGTDFPVCHSSDEI